jgi:guanosine-3',5'-bis(diphosphate) 3'-pyrophosphohydrolase
MLQAPKLMQAAQFAAERHSKQRRKDADQTPYVNHLIEVASILAEVIGDDDVDLLCAALLHDTIEDVGVTPAELAERFGEDVAQLVTLVTDDKTLPKAERKRLQVENAPHKPRRAQWLKMADKISNLRSVQASPPRDWSGERRLEYVQWAERVIGGFREPHPVLLEKFTLLAEEIRKELEAVEAGSGADGRH